MLTPEAFNAFLKTLEEPPEYAVFILATTDPQRLLPTVLSRCQRYDFRRIPTKIIEERLREVLDAEAIEAEDEAVHTIARRAEGGMRDALSIADQCASFFPGETLTYDHVLEVLGTVDTEVYRQMMRFAIRGNASSLIRKLDDLLMDGRDVRQIVSDFTWYLRDLLIFKASAGSGEMDDLIEEDRQEMLEDADSVNEKQVMYFIEVLSDLSGTLKISSNRRVLTEIALIRLCRPQTSPGSLDALQSRLSVVEQKLEEGIVVRSDVQTAGSIPAQETVQSGGESETGGKKVVKAIAPALFQKIAAQWRQTMNSLPRDGTLHGRGQVLAGCCEPYFSEDDPETLYLPLTRNWYDSMAGDLDLQDAVREALADKYGVSPQIQFVDASESASRGLIKVESKEDELLKSGIDFPIEMERI